MVSFQCEGCGDVLTKKKLDAHVNRCANAHFSCIDCMKTFYDYSYRAHTTCMTEEQKTHGSLYKGNDKRQRAPKHNVKMHAPSTPNDDRTVAKVDVPPPAPSPPRGSQAVNVFDFMVRDGEREAPASPGSGASSPRKSNGDASPRSLNQDHDDDNDGNPRRGFSYGGGPVRGGLQHFDSDLTGHNMQVDAKFAPTVNHTPITLHKDLKTPLHNGQNGHARGKSTEKKRKRPQIDELDLSDTKGDSSDGRKATLHTGLTGGLTRLLTKPDQHEEAASPLSPKKRSKHKTKQDDSDAEDSDEDKRRRRKERRQSKHKRHRSDGDDLQLVRTDPASRQVELHASSTRDKGDDVKRQLPEQANSEFFLGLVDKDFTSSKGQSIWGTLKTFHEGLQCDSMEDAFDLAGAHQRAEKRLFKGLRMKLNRHGEVVLFAKPDKEDE